MIWGIPAEVWQAMQNGENPWGQAQAEKLAKDNAEKAKEAEAEAKKTPEEKKADGLRAASRAGETLARRIMGIVDRETGKITDQFTVLEDFKDETDAAIKASFVKHLDIILRERGLVEDEEDES